MNGKNVVVIGGSTGIGAGICEAAVKRGAKVHLCDIDVEGAAALKGRFPEGAITTYACNVTQPDSLAAAEAAIRTAGPISCLFVNAGSIAIRPFLETSNADWEWLFGINLYGTVNALRAFLPGLLEQAERPRVVITSSLAAVARIPMPGMTIYAASKAAQLGFFNALLDEYAGKNVNLSVVFPGSVNSSLGVKSEQFRPGVNKLDVPTEAVNDILEPPVAGERIVQAVERGQTYISTHPRLGEDVRELQAQILEAYPGHL